MRTLTRIEHRYGLAAGYFKRKLPNRSGSVTGNAVPDMCRRRGRHPWHLPPDYRARPRAEQDEIQRWIRDKTGSCLSDYRRYLTEASKKPYALRFRWFDPAGEATQWPDPKKVAVGFGNEVRRSASSFSAPCALADEIGGLIGFKTSTLTPMGYERTGLWSDETARQQLQHLGILFGALAASPEGPAHGYGVPLDNLCLAHLVFPAVWDWFVQWRERRRGFYTGWEVNMLCSGAALTRPRTGWIRQTPSLRRRLTPITGLISPEEIGWAQDNWDEACTVMHNHAVLRQRDLRRVARAHRDPFEPILPVLEADSPLREYRKIADEIVRLMPDEQRCPMTAAEAVRAILFIRLALHTGLRQKNLRELLVCPRGGQPSTERQLVDRKVGELRWNSNSAMWEVFIPTVAFKNATSSFFANKPFLLRLSDVADLYKFIDSYLIRHRPRLLGGTQDPGTFFVKTMRINTPTAVYDQRDFYVAWRQIICRYGIYNPYTGRGAIRGLQPHGPHNVRDVLATHILKQTGSYEHAGYAIQDTPQAVEKYYGRFLPVDKSALAARVLNRVWE
jgi:hypothetical protein